MISVSHNFQLTHSTWTHAGLPLVHTLALLRTSALYTIVWHIFLYTTTHTHAHAHTHTRTHAQRTCTHTVIHTHTHTYTLSHTHTHTHTHVQRTCTHQLYMWQTIHLSDDGTNTLSIQLYLCMPVQTTDSMYICVPSFLYMYRVSKVWLHCVPIWYSKCTQTLHTCTHTKLAHTHHCINVAIHMQKRSHTTHRYTDTHMTYTHKHTHTYGHGHTGTHGHTHNTQTDTHTDTHT